IIDSRKIRKAIKENTILVSVMYANNEIGTIQPIMEIAKEIRHYNKLNSKKIIFHTDATQAINYLPTKVEKLGIDLMSFNGGKIYGPKGVGVLYIKRKTPISKIIFGGDQEFGLRAGTENVVNIVGLSEALKITEEIKQKELERLIKLRNYFIQKLYDLKNQNSKFSRVLGLGPDQLENFSFNFLLNGDLEKRLPNNINITIPKIPSDLLVLEFSARGIYISEKSACKSGDKKGSYVIEALYPRGKASGVVGRRQRLRPSLRFSLGRQTTKADIDYVIKSLFEILIKLNKWYN
ncbi:MAG: aminotransferase class V-fold PLP-dependent enzyme, partial [Candidatus Paceibacterota bacterium]